MTHKQVVQTPEEVVQLAVEALITDLQEAILNQGMATWVLAGGTLPARAYTLLAEKYLHSIDWSKVNFLIGDERCVPNDSPDSSWGQAAEAFLDKLPLSDYSIRPKTDGSAEEAAEDYQKVLEQLPHKKHGLPQYDIVWLGVGEDGHTLSLFPNHPSLEPTDELVIPVHDSPKPPPDRISLTLHALRGTQKAYIIAAGVGKQEILAQVVEPDCLLPIRQAADTITEAGGDVCWLLDEAAAKLLHS